LSENALPRAVKEAAGRLSGSKRGEQRSSHKVEHIYQANRPAVDAGKYKWKWEMCEWARDGL